MTHPFKEVTLTAEQDYALAVARTGFMAACPFFAHYFYAEMSEVYTTDLQTAATDGRRIFINPEYVCALKPSERVFVYAHEVHHAVSRHPERMKHYSSGGKLRGKEWSNEIFNHAADYCINADLLENGIGMCNPAWLFDPTVPGSALPEDVFEKIWKKPPPSSKGGAGQGGGLQGTTYGASGKGPNGGKSDAAAAGRGGSFDDVLEPAVDPVTGREDVPSPSEFKEAVARAAAAAKAMGKMPGSFKRMVDEILEPQTDWREHIRTLFTGHVGGRRETWDRPNRRRLALNPIVIMPGRRGHGADTVACVVDNSGSIGERELSAFFAEVGGVIADVRPRRVVLIWCDAQVQQVDIATSLDELQDLRVKGSPGGGGTSFIPPFIYLEKEGIKPEALVYITDMMGTFPHKAPAYPVIWCASTDRVAPWGDTVRIRVED